MTCTLHVAWDDRMTGYDFGPNHPLAPVRLELTIALARHLGVLNAPGVMLRAPDPGGEAELQLVHSSAYIEAVREAGRRAGEQADRAGHGEQADRAGHGEQADRAGRGEQADQAGHGEPAAQDPAVSGGDGALLTWLGFGLGTPDNPIFPGMHEAASLAVGATLAAAEAAWSGTAQHGVSIAGGLHHAMTDRASGFCIYNDPAIAITWLLRQGAQRIAYVDIDVHHGDGVQAAFWREPRVLTISLHQDPTTLFPGTGMPSEIGGPGAEGSAVNVALPAGTRDAGWLRAFHAVVPPLVRTFQPQILVSQHGCDTHWRDPLANLEITIDSQRAVHHALHQLAHEVTQGRWLATGGGGYELVRVVPLSWTHLLAEAAGLPLDPDTPVPGRWRELAASRTGLTAPEVMTEHAPAAYVPFEHGYDPADPVDQAIAATRDAVFARNGLMPS